MNTTTTTMQPMGRKPSADMPEDERVVLENARDIYRGRMRSATEGRELLFAAVKAAAAKGYAQAEIARVLGMTRAEVGRIVHLGRRHG